MISMNYGSSTSSWKPWRWVRFDLTLSMRDIYINANLNPLTKFTSSNKNTEFKDILPRKISQMITKTVPIGKRIVTSNTMKRGCIQINRSIYFQSIYLSEKTLECTKHTVKLYTLGLSTSEIYPTNFDVWSTAEYAQSSNWVLKLSLHQILF